MHTHTHMPTHNTHMPIDTLAHTHSYTHTYTYSDTHIDMSTHTHKLGN